MSDDPPKKPGLREPVPTPGDTRIPSMVAEMDDTGQIQLRKVKPGEIPIIHSHRSNTPLPFPAQRDPTPTPPAAPAAAPVHANGNGNGKVGMKALLGIIGTVAAAAVAFSAYAFTTFAGKSDVAAQQTQQQQVTDGLDTRVGTLETNQAALSTSVSDLKTSVDTAETKREQHDADVDDKLTKILLHIGGGK